MPFNKSIPPLSDQSSSSMLLKTKHFSDFIETKKALLQSILTLCYENFLRMQQRKNKIVYIYGANKSPA